MRTWGPGLIGALALIIPTGDLSAEPPPPNPPPPGPGWGTLKPGEKAPMFRSVDEQMRPVDMRDMIRQRPLVLLVGSVT